jgi:hypothetical protein
MRARGGKGSHKRAAFERKEREPDIGGCARLVLRREAGAPFSGQRGRGAGRGGCERTGALRPCARVGEWGERKWCETGIPFCGRKHAVLSAQQHLPPPQAKCRAATRRRSMAKSFAVRATPRSPSRAAPQSLACRLGLPVVFSGAGTIAQARAPLSHPLLPVSLAPAQCPGRWWSRQRCECCWPVGRTTEAASPPGPTEARTAEGPRTHTTWGDSLARAQAQARGQSGRAACMSGGARRHAREGARRRPGRAARARRRPSGQDSDAGAPPCILLSPYIPPFPRPSSSSSPPSPLLQERLVHARARPRGP